MTKTIEEEVKDAIETIRAKIVADYTFLAEFLPEQDIPDDTFPTLATNGIVLRYNPKFMYGRNKNDRMFLYMHEIVHNFLAHPLRIRPEHDFDTAQSAADYVTNDLLDDAGFTLPRDALVDYKYRGLAYEEVYALLMQKKKNNPNDSQKHDTKRKGVCEPQPKGKPEKGDPHEPKSDDPHENESTNAEQELQKQLEAHEQRQLGAMQVAEMVGNVSMDLQRRFNAMKEKTVNWKEALPTEIEAVLGMEDYSYAVPNVNIDDDTFIYPGMVGAKVKPIGIIADTSGSISPNQLTEIVADIVGIIEQAEPEKVFILGVDSALKSFQEFDGDDTSIKDKIELKGGGGTSFIPGIEALNKQEDELGLVIYLTDGCCYSYPPVPDYPVVWLLYGGNKRFNPPFGNVIKMG